MQQIEPKYFWVDHFSTLLYVESRCVDYGGKLDLQHLRRWGDRGKYPTRLQDGVKVDGHDDFGCIDDMEAAGWLVNTGTGVNMLIRLTDLGWYIAGFLRRYAAEHQDVRYKVPKEVYLDLLKAYKPAQERPGVQSAAS